MVHRLAGPVLGGGLVLVVLARVLIPGAPPLYDGVVPIEPYVWLEPPPGDPGGAKGASADIPVRGTTVGLVAVATPELEPQAQVFAEPGGLTVASGARTVKVSIEPVPSEGEPAQGHVDGNVYRISVTDDRGRLVTAPAAARVSVVLRASDPAQAVATIDRFSGGSWQPLKTSASGFAGTFLAVVTSFGDFAVVVPGAAPTGSGSGSSSPSASVPVSGSAGALFSGQPASAPASSVPILPPSSGGDGLGLAGWLLIALVVVAVVIAIVGYRLARTNRPQRQPYRGAHPRRRR